MVRSPVQNAQLALLLEVCGTPKPGNVDRHRDLPGLRFEHFLSGAVGALPGLRSATDGSVGVGMAFERAVAGMATQRGGNTQFGALLLVVPLLRATGRADGDALERSAVESVIDGTTVADAAAFYRAFDHVDVFVADPPAGASPLDVRRGSEAIPALEERGLTLAEVLAMGVPGDDVAREWTTGFERSFRAASLLASSTGPIERRTSETFCELLADRPDTLVAKKHGEAVATEVSDRAASILEGEPEGFEHVEAAIETFADDLVAREINPGTTADITAAGLFIALEREAIAV